MPKPRIVTGYRPTGKLHLGHWFGNLQNMIAMQRSYEAFYFIADWHALTSHWQDTSHIRLYTEEMVLDWCAAGIDREVSTIYRQSDVPEVAQLSLYFDMITPMSWLERVPSYKEQREQITDKDLGNAGFFLYPVLQAADIAITLAEAVPVGEDQAPHLELTREIVRRFNSTWGDVLVEPKAMIPEEGARVPGLDGRKMSKSYGNAIFISDTPEEISTKVMTMVTDPARKLKTDPGNPDICPLQQIHKLVGEPGVIAEFDACCRDATCGCVAHKRKLIEDLTVYLGPFRERREELAAIPGFAWDVLAEGARKVRPVAAGVIDECRRVVRIDDGAGASAPDAAESDSDDAEEPF